MVAAATTSLPERADAGRNYDYRYFWIHDQCYTGQVIAAAGAHPCWTTRPASCPRACSRTAPTSPPPTPPRAGRYPTSANSDYPASPAATTWSATGSTAVPARRLRRGTAAPGGSRTPRPPRRRPTRRRRCRQRDHRSTQRPRRRCVGDRRPRLDTQPAHLRCRPARGRNPCRYYPRGSRVVCAGRLHPRRNITDIAAPDRSVATLTERPRSRRGAAPTTDPGRTGRARPANAQHPAGLPRRAHHRLPRLPVPPR